MLHDDPAELVRLVGAHRHLKPPVMQLPQQLRDAGVGVCALHVVCAVIAVELMQRIRQHQGTAGVFR